MFKTFNDEVLLWEFISAIRFCINLKNLLCFLGDCFPSMAKVKLENGKTVAMSELQKGDIVHSGIDLHPPNFSHLKIQLGARDWHPPSQSKLFNLVVFI